MPPQTAEGLADALRPLLEAPKRAAVLCDVDGTLAPIAPRADAARVPPEVSRAIAALAPRYGLVGCISGRSALDARRLVGVGGIAYAGMHGAEILQPSESRPAVSPALAEYRDRVRGFAATAWSRVRPLGIRHEDKGPIWALHWRGVANDAAAQTALEEVAREAEAEGLAVHWGRKVLEIRPPVRISKADAVTSLLEGRLAVRAALFGGDDATDLDAFDALDSLVARSRLDAAVKVGVASAEGPEDIVRRADVVVEGPAGFHDVLAALAAA
ncbi:MAG: trehalose-phosphatase [Actinobacteria bacterium]|nr:trehalose-phosphatase [Actinomycetota bacterium]